MKRAAEMEQSLTTMQSVIAAWTGERLPTRHRVQRLPVFQTDKRRADTMFGRQNVTAGLPDRVRTRLTNSEAAWTSQSLRRSSSRRSFVLSAAIDSFNTEERPRYVRAAPR